MICSLMQLPLSPVAKIEELGNLKLTKKHFGYINNPINFASEIHYDKRFEWKPKFLILFLLSLGLIPRRYRYSNESLGLANGPALFKLDKIPNLELVQRVMSLTTRPCIDLMARIGGKKAGGEGFGEVTAEEGFERREREGEPWRKEVEMERDLNWERGSWRRGEVRDIGDHEEERIPGLELNFYKKSCPNAEQFVKEEVSRSLLLDPSAAAALLRLAFPDCQVDGCDGSVLLSFPNSLKTKTESEMNFGLRKLDIINGIKSSLERICPQTVSCADIIQLAARDDVYLIKGQSLMSSDLQAISSSSLEALHQDS
ncbi:hypothetical protein HAX54_016260 [Datura stramonium]|uniref:Peroxidase n=1 Tax=Datura stramonium TaxID=4076 RepID=A0ABS8UKV7_DATST|nr:hypothetical protein [Datura stramonium]